MSSAVIKAPELQPEIRLAQAVSEFEADLSTEQKATFQSFRLQSRENPPDISDVMRLTAEIDRRVTGSVGGRQCFGPRFTNILQAVQQFAALGDIVIGGSQNLVACGVWSLIRTTLLSMVNVSSYMDKASSLFMAVGRSAPRYQRMAILYPKSRHLQVHLYEYFLSIVRLCHYLVRTAQKSAFAQVLSFMNDSALKKHQADLEYLAASIRDEVALLTAQKIEEHTSMFSSLSTTQNHRRRLKNLDRVLDACSQYDYQTSWKEIRRCGSSTIMIENGTYLDWRARNDSCTLVCTGKLGSGKSVLLANIVDDLNLASRSGRHPVAYLFCRHDVHESLKAQTVIGSLARQLLCKFVNRVAEEHIDQNTKTLGFYELQGLIQRCFPESYKAYVVLDGLDECNDQERRLLVQELRRMQATIPLLVCLSLRSKAGNILTGETEQLIRTTFVALPEENPDIAGFIDAELERRLDSGRLSIGHPALIQHIRDALLAGAQGMFLWVVLQIDSLCYATTDEEIRQALGDLPKDLTETFCRLMKRIQLKPQQRGGDHQKRIFELCTVALRPLTLPELREALSVVPGDIEWNPARLPNDMNATLALCGSLVTVDEESLTVRLIHHSVKQFLLDGGASESREFVTMGDAARTMGWIIITYLNYATFETQLSTIVHPQLPVGSMPLRVIESLSSRPGIIRKLAVRLLKSQGQLAFDVSKTLAGACSSNKPREDLYPFYAYARAYWFPHVDWIEDRQSEMYNLLERFLGRSSINISLETKNASGNTPLLWAAESGHNNVVKLLLNNGANVEAKDEYDETPLCKAAKSGHNNVVKLLLDNGVNIEAKNKYDKTPLYIAARSGHNRVV